MNASWYAITPESPPRGVFVRLKWSGRRFLAMRTVHPQTRQMAWLTYEGASDAHVVSETRLRHDASAPSTQQRPARGNAVYLPDRSPAPDPRRPWVGWHTLSRDGPEAWQPLDAAAWDGPLPEPLYVAGPEAETGRMVSIGMKFREVEAAEIEDMSVEEMAAERADMRHDAEARSRSEQDGQRPDAGAAGASGHPKGASKSAQWWTDPNTVSYSAPGSISTHEAEGRLMRAFNTERWVKADRPGAPTFSRLLAINVKPEPLTPGEAAALDPPPVRLDPTPADLRDYATAREWTKALAFRRGPSGADQHPGSSRGPSGADQHPGSSRGPSGAHQHPGRMPSAKARGGHSSAEAGAARAERIVTPDLLLSLVSIVPALGWREIGRRLGMSHEAARTHYGRDLEAITAAANGRATDGTRLVADELDRVREANRTSRRGG